MRRSREWAPEQHSEEAPEAKTKGLVFHGKIVGDGDIVRYRKEEGKVLTDHSFECGSCEIIFNSIALKHMKCNRKNGQPPLLLLRKFCQGFHFLSEISALVSIHNKEGFFTAEEKILGIATAQVRPTTDIVNDNFRSVRYLGE